MARTLQEIVESHLGRMQWQAISLAFQVEQAELKIRELEARVPRDVGVKEPATEAPDGR